MNNQALVCLKCKGGEFTPDVRDVKQIFCKKTLMVNTSVMVCNKCGWFTIGNGQIDELLAKTRAAYQMTRGKR